MKPTIWKYCGEWVCAYLEEYPDSDSADDYAVWYSCGYGATPQEAYEDWKSEIKRIYEDTINTEVV